MAMAGGRERWELVKGFQIEIKMHQMRALDEVDKSIEHRAGIPRTLQAIADGGSVNDLVRCGSEYDNPPHL